MNTGLRPVASVADFEGAFVAALADDQMNAVYSNTQSKKIMTYGNLADFLSKRSNVFHNVIKDMKLECEKLRIFKVTKQNLR